MQQHAASIGQNTNARARATERKDVEARADLRERNDVDTRVTTHRITNLTSLAS